MLLPHLTLISPKFEIESVFFTHQFWHHHLVHGTNIATPASLEGAPSDTLLGDQLCQWSSVGATADSLLLASHLTVRLPPRIGAYVLANHKTNASLVTDPEVAGQNSRSNYVVKQRSQFRSPIMGSDMALTAARASASAGHVPPGLVPFLASPNADIIQHRLNWTLRFPLPGPAPNDPNAHRFANLALHASGHNSNESLRNAIQLHQTFSQTNAMVTNPTFLRVPDPSNGTGQLTQHPAVALDQIVARWLREGAPRVNSRSHPNPATRPFIPAALFSFFDGAISLPQCSQLIAQHLAKPRSLIMTPTSHIPSAPRPKAKEKEKDEVRAKGKAKKKVKMPHRRPVPLTLLAKVRVKALVRQNNPIIICLAHLPSPLRAVHLRPSEVDATPSTPPTACHALGRPFRAVWSVHLVLHHLHRAGPSIWCVNIYLPEFPTPFSPQLAPASGPSI